MNVLQTADGYDISKLDHVYRVKQGHDNRVMVVEAQRRDYANGFYFHEGGTFTLCAYGPSVDYCSAQSWARDYYATIEHARASDPRFRAQAQADLLENKIYARYYEFEWGKSRTVPPGFEVCLGNDGLYHPYYWAPKMGQGSAHWHGMSTVGTSRRNAVKMCIDAYNEMRLYQAEREAIGTV